MSRVRWVGNLAIVAAFASVVVGLLQVDSLAQTARLHPRRIAVFGSSVANGVGDELGRDGYTGVLRQLMAARGWEVLNQSRGGDTTRRILPRWAPEGAPDPRVRYLLPVNPSYVIIGLSLGNEGVFEAKTKEDKDAVARQYLDGIRSLVERVRQQNMVPVVTLAYTRGDFTPVEYEYTRAVNVEQSTWSVPTVNFLGAIDDGAGRWARGFMYDDRHPNAAGHKELAYAFVPSLFEALEQQKPPPARPASNGFARVARGIAPLTFAPSDTMHPFALGVTVRTRDNGTVAAVAGATLAAQTEMKTVNAAQAVLQLESTTLKVDRPFTATIGVQNGRWIYRSAAGTSVTSPIPADGQWHHIVLSHYTARGQTLFFVDGRLAGSVMERLEPARFTVGGPGAGAGPAAPGQADYRDVLVFRSALNADDVAALHAGKLLTSSLEVYAPLTDAQFQPNGAVENRAQSLAALKVGSERITPLTQNATN